MGAVEASAVNDVAIRLWEVASGRPKRMLAAPQVQVASLAFSPAGALLASGAEDGTLRLWGLAP